MGILISSSSSVYYARLYAHSSLLHRLRIYTPRVCMSIQPEGEPIPDLGRGLVLNHEAHANATFPRHNAAALLSQL